MANHLNVDPSGLRSAAAGSESIAAELGAGPGGGVGGGRTSYAAISALDSALSSTRGAHARRVDDDGGRLRIGSGVYERHDDDSATNIARTLTI